MRKGLVILGAMVALTLLFTVVPGAEAPVEQGEEAQVPAPAAEEAAGDQARLHKDASILQTLCFSLCGHSVTRRFALPSSLAGADFSTIQAQYDQWQVEEFSPEKVSMNREVDLFCPLHWVVACNEAGEIVRCRNLYGDGMAIDKVYPLTMSELGEEDRENMLLGLGFDSAQEADAWVAAH